MSRGAGRRQRPPLPQRRGVDPVRLVLPGDGGWETLGGHLRDRLGPIGVTGVARLFAEGRVVDGEGRPLRDDTAYAAGEVVWVERELAPEVPVPFPLTVLHRDERIVVVDKPPFLASMPRGRHVVQTALARARHELGLPDLALAHRLDRLTSGVLVLVADPALRGAYQELFARREVVKTYLAVAPVQPDLVLPHVVRSHLRKDRSSLQAVVVPDLPANSATRVELVGRRGDRGLYRLTPTGGRTHQLRVHLSGLGLPIANDPLYPVVRDVDADDLTHPLLLLAARLAFTDPVDGSPRVFRSRQGLAGWPAAEVAAAIDHVEAVGATDATEAVHEDPAALT